MPSLPTFPSIDFSALDARTLADLDDKVAAALRDAAYVAIGFGVLGVQQLQVRRRELATALAGRAEARKDRVEDVLRSVETRLGSLDERLDAMEAGIDRLVDRIEGSLPEQAASVVGQAHELAKAARKQVRGLIRSAA